MKVCSSHKHLLNRGETYQLVEPQECVFCKGGMYYSDVLDKGVVIKSESS